MRALLVLLSLLVVSPAEASTAPVLRCDGCWPTALAFTPRGDLFYLEMFFSDSEGIHVLAA